MFLDARLLDCVAYGTQGGPSWSTRRIGLRSGKTRRNPRRSLPLYKFAIVYRNLLPGNHRDVIAAFNACMAGVHSFRLKDWSDFEADDELFPVLGTGAPQTLQLIKTYSFGGASVARVITKPVAGTVVITGDDVEIPGATIDTDTGQATFTAGSGDVLRWSGEFDVPVFFTDDELSFSFADRNAEGLFLTADVALEEDTDA
jgi:uncharacterized protein (TIGR02217 family)